MAHEKTMKLDQEYGTKTTLTLQKCKQPYVQSPNHHITPPTTSTLIIVASLVFAKKYQIGLIRNQ